MSENKIKEVILEEEPVAEAPKRVKRPAKSSRSLLKMMNLFGIFERNQIVNAMPFILFVSFLLVIYIANSYYAEKIIRNIDSTKKVLKERRAEYISTMSTLMYNSKQSEVARALQSDEIKETTEPPKEIFVKETQQTGK
jgi:hypothetical protein